MELTESSPQTGSTESSRVHGCNSATARYCGLSRGMFENVALQARLARISLAIGIFVLGHELANGAELPLCHGAGIGNGPDFILQISPPVAAVLHAIGGYDDVHPAGEPLCGPAGQLRHRRLCLIVPATSVCVRGSSIMPQKKNYDLFEIMRANGKARHAPTAAPLALHPPYANCQLSDQGFLLELNCSNWVRVGHELQSACRSLVRCRCRSKRQSWAWAAATIETCSAPRRPSLKRVARPGEVCCWGALICHESRKRLSARRTLSDVPKIYS